jgi:uncharacterized Zn-finger protein
MFAVYPQDVDWRMIGRKRKIRPTVETYDCRWCDRSFTKPYNLLIHERNHSNTGLFHCDICGKGFRSKDTMKCHKLMHTPPSPPKELNGLMTECTAY